MTAGTRPRIDFAPDPAMSYWPTPSDLADELVYWILEPWHGTGDILRILEPSAGTGHLVAAIRHRLPDAHITAVEPDPARAEQLAAVGFADEVIHATLEEHLVAVSLAAVRGTWQPYHLAIANPPFTLPGRREAWAEHLLALYHHPDALRPGAVIAAIVPRSVFTGSVPKIAAVRRLLHPTGCGQARPTDRDAFAPVGMGNPTALLWTQRPFDTAGALW
jgi:predicted RNA methylase